MSKEQRRVCKKALLDNGAWEEFIRLPQEAITQCALVNPFIARRLAREGRATPLIFVRALWHLFEHRGFDWYDRVRDGGDDFLAEKETLLQHLKSLVLTNDGELGRIRKEIEKRDSERAEESSRAKPWLSDKKIEDELQKAHQRGKGYPISRRLNVPRHYVEQELRACLQSLSLERFGGDFGRRKGQDPLSEGEKRGAVFNGLKKLLSWNRREPRFDNRQLRGCTWCAAKGTFRNTSRKKNVPDRLMRAAIRDIKVAVEGAAMSTGISAQGRHREVSISATARWLKEEEVKQLESLVFDSGLSRDDLKERLDEFFKHYARLPKRVFVTDGQRIRKASKPTNPYQWHREELLNLFDGWRYQQTRGMEGRKIAGRSRLCVHCLIRKAQTPPDQLQPPVGEAEMILSQRALKARCDRLISWIGRHLPPQTYPVQYIRIEAVRMRPEEKARLKAESQGQEAEQSPKAKLKFRLMEELGATCNACRKPYLERQRRGASSQRDGRYCQCPRPELQSPCAYCPDKFSALQLEVEHIYPKNPINTQGGIGPDVQVNKTVACEKCNRQGKRDRLPFDYFQTIVGNNSWEKWKRRIHAFNWPPAKRRIALLVHGIINSHRVLTG